MKLSEVRSALNQMDKVAFLLPDGEAVPHHFHITEIGLVHKHFIDCGGTVRRESVINFQLWTSTDYDHRLSASKLRSIITLSEKELDLPDLEIEVEYQSGTIGKYGLASDGSSFRLINKQTDCLAKEQCGVPAQKTKVKLADLQTAESCCSGSSCC